MKRDVILSKSNEPPFMEIVDENPFAISFPLFGTGEVYEDIKTLYVVAIDRPLIYFELKALNIPVNFQVLFSTDKNIWVDKLVKRGEPYIIDGTGNYDYIPVYVKVRFTDTLDNAQIGNFKSMRFRFIYA